ncbi:hypothetical protein CFC21_089029 [Triticum aestivum]|uniref:Uncharacterized protein n=2 Tax=Triticum aestivum TaxID=4565 RepID=A0A9R1LCF4_WHEAT|nr:hypothetical protein CFC21_089029 [Triticum aestivum]
MSPYDLFASTLHYMMPSLKIDLKNHLLGYDDTYTIGGIALICDDHNYFSHASLELNDKCHPRVSIDHADFCHPKHVLLNETHHFHASLELNDKCHPRVSIDHADFCHPKYVLYRYAYIIGYSIDDLEGIDRITCSSLCESYFRLFLLHCLLHADQVRGDIPWDPGGVRAWR